MTDEHTLAINRWRINRERGATRFDDVSNPAHYTSGTIECIDAIEDALSGSEFQGYCLGNVLKYVWRHNKKGVGMVDLHKAKWYLDSAIDASDQT